MSEYQRQPFEALPFHLTVQIISSLDFCFKQNVNQCLIFLIRNVSHSHNYISVQNIKTYKNYLPEPGMPMPRCLHCQYITDGATIQPDMIKAENLNSPKLSDFSDFLNK